MSIYLNRTNRSWMVAGKYPDTQLILFVDKTEEHHLEKLRQRYANQIQLESLYYPIQPQQLQNLIMPANSK
jgi:disulfide oxidoreductase YuzD